MLIPCENCANACEDEYGYIHCDIPYCSTNIGWGECDEYIPLFDVPDKQQE